MSYDLMVFNKRKRFKRHEDFLTWYDEVIEWKEDVDYDDYRHATPELQHWFLAMKDIVPPLNGEFAPSEEEEGKGAFQEADYSIASEAIYACFAWSDAEKVHDLVLAKAKECDVAFFDVSSTDGTVIYPDGTTLIPKARGKEANPFWHIIEKAKEKLSGFFKPKKEETPARKHSLSGEIALWLQTLDATENVPEEISALYFGLFENGDSNYCIYAIGSKVYDEHDDDWACEEDYTPEHKYHEIEDPAAQRMGWETFQAHIVASVSTYIDNHPDSPLFKNRVVAVGFDDGDLVRVK